MVLSTTRPNGLSSTLRTRSPGIASEATPASAFELAASEALARLKVTVKVKVVPPPRRGATTISPPIARASAFTDDSPSPAPPKRDAMLTLACENGRNRRLISLSVSPIPLSEIANETATLPLWPSIGSTASATPPASVNFTALSIRFSNAARRRTGSPTTSAGSSSEISTWDCRPFAAARPASESPALRASTRRSKKSCRTPAAARPPFAASTNNVARLARCSAPALMVSTQRRSRSSRSDVASRLLMARIPVSGVRTSCANAASAASTIPGAGIAAARLLRALPEATPGALFLSDRLFDGRVMRSERDFGGMIPTLANLTMPRPGCGSHAGGIFQLFQLGIVLPQLRQTHEAADIGRRRSRGAQFAQARGQGRLREFSPRIIEDEAVVPVGGWRQTEQSLQEPMDAGRPEQVLPPHRFCHALQRVVDHHREVIAGRRLPAREDDIPPGLRPGGHRAGLAIGTCAALDPAEIAGALTCRRHVEPQRIGRARFKQPRALLGRERFRRAVIERRAVGIARPRRLRLLQRYQSRDLGTALETRINQALGDEFIDRIAIFRKVFRLPPHRLLPPDAEPAEVFINRGLEFRLAAGGVDILDAKQKSPAGPARGIEIQQRRISVAEMQMAVRARRKTEDGRRHGVLNTCRCRTS